MKKKIVYVFEAADAEILRKAYEIMNTLYNAAEIEFEDDAVEVEVIDAFGRIEDLCVDSEDLNEADEEYFDDFDDFDEEYESDDDYNEDESIEE